METQSSEETQTKALGKRLHKTWPRHHCGPQSSPPVVYIHAGDNTWAIIIISILVQKDAVNKAGQRERGRPDDSGLVGGERAMAGVLEGWQSTQHKPPTPTYIHTEDYHMYISQLNDSTLDRDIKTCFSLEL